MTLIWYHITMILIRRNTAIEYRKNYGKRCIISHLLQNLYKLAIELPKLLHFTYVTAWTARLFN